MASIKWCCGQKDGIRLIEPNDNLALGYIKMAEDAIGTMSRERGYNGMFAISACYYSMYYSLYAILMKIGVKCEIHSCTLEFMKFALSEAYSSGDISIIKKAFDARSTAQYYADRVVTKEDSDFIMSKAPYFLNKSKEILSRINEKDITMIRKRIREIGGNNQ
ncbi:MAG: HEPN domain-containing protein [archaeon]